MSHINFQFIEANLSTETKKDNNEEKNRLINEIRKNNNNVIDLTTNDKKYLEIRNTIEDQLINHITIAANTTTSTIRYAKWAINNKKDFLKKTTIGYVIPKIKNIINEISNSYPITICIVLMGGAMCCAVYDKRLPAKHQSTFGKKLKQLIDKYISQRNKELIKKAALTPVWMAAGIYTGLLTGPACAILCAGAAAPVVTVCAAFGYGVPAMATATTAITTMSQMAAATGVIGNTFYYPYSFWTNDAKNY